MLPEELAGRKDLRDWDRAIDGEAGIWMITLIKNAGQMNWVSISPMSPTTSREHSPLDEEALKRGTSVASDRPRDSILPISCQRVSVP